MKNRLEVLSRELRKPANKQIVRTIVITALLTSSIVFGVIWMWAFQLGQADRWDLTYANEKYLRDLHSNTTQTKLREWLPNNEMNFTDGLIWESNLLEYTVNRASYEDVIQVLKSGKGACGEFVWVFAAFCIANGIPVRIVTLGYFNPGVVDHSWVQINPSNDGKT